MQWKDQYFLASTTEKSNRMVQAVLKQIENHRNGEEVDSSMIKEIVNSLGKRDSSLRPVMRC